ncbi:hypothetical protein SAMN04487972_106172 [Paracoccus halophilus]|uniref:RSAM-associated Gly-rich repeat protein n=1 Tax=Paracoccus halophilus TaxID=376733 RepID=A0A099F5A8_9RHOB|nr:hypothetical protein IT41_06700 [Paracoccus halophilus]SFA49308.1 hypothetical protein SAMN04487972_106172 [Paracoccus halophilus]
MREFRFLIAAILATAASAGAAPFPNDALTVQDQRRALDERLDRLGRQLREETAEADAPRRWAQWYNWGNWSNGFSNWRNW